MISLKSLVAAGLTLIAPPPNADPRLAPWFKSLEVPGTEHHGLGCCDIADCRNLPVRTDSEHYLVFHSDRWLVVAPEAVSDRTDNPTGDYISVTVASVTRCDEGRGQTKSLRGVSQRGGAANVGSEA